MKAREGCRPHITSIPGPSLNPNTRNILKNVRFLKENSRSLRNRTDLVLWHDTINSTTKKHRSNKFRHCDQDRFRFEAIVYCTRKGAPDIVKSLLKTGILVIQVTKHIIPRQKQRDYWCLKQYKGLHQEAALELKTLDIIWRHRRNLRSLLKQAKGKPKLGKQQRQARASRSLNGANFLLTNLLSVDQVNLV